MAKVKKSAVIAFVELLNSVANNEEVLLLRSSDRNANDALQTYNDTLNGDEEVDPKYVGFVDRLAEKFAMRRRKPVLLKRVIWSRGTSGILGQCCCKSPIM
jgi:hypothetical protein